MNTDRSLRRGALLALLALAVAGASAHAGSATATAPWAIAPYATATFWGSAGADFGNTRYAPLEWRINRHSVGQLQLAWSFTTAGNITTAPTVEGNALYVPDWGGMLYRLDADTGIAVWSRKLSDWTGIARSLSRNSPAIGPDSIVLGDHSSGTVMAVDKTTGELLWQTLVDAHPDALITASPVIVGNRIYVGVSSSEESHRDAGHEFSFRGSVVALDLRTGAVEWRFNTVPAGYSGGAIWGGMAIDPLRRRLYAATGNNYVLPAAVNTCVGKAGSDATAQIACLAPDDYLDAVVSLDLDSGALRWASRLQGLDIWTKLCTLFPASPQCPDPLGPDYDFSGGGTNLFTVRAGGKLRQWVGASQKSGVYWALDAETGKTVWSTQVGPGSLQWGAAVDSYRSRIYLALNNTEHTPYLLAPHYQQSWNAGSWAALDAVTGRILWQVPVAGTSPVDPSYGGDGLGAVTASPGVVYAGSTSGDLVALDAGNGSTLWHFTTPGSVISGPAVVGGALYWGSGYYAPLTGNNKLYKFELPRPLSPH